MTFIAFFILYIEKYKVVAFFAYGFEEVLALDCLDESFIWAFIQEGLHWNLERIYIYASHVVAYPIFHLTKIAFSIVCYGVHIYFTTES